jgi:FkbM family methyltransferase
MLRWMLTKLGRPVFRRLDGDRYERFLRNHYRKWCLKDELLVETQEGFRMFVSPRDYTSHRIFFHGIYDWPMGRMMKAYIPDGGTCWDIGTERGWFTLLMGTLVGPKGRVDSFEAFPPNFRKLQRNVELNALSWVRSYNLAVSDRSGQLYFVPPSDEVMHHAQSMADCDGVGYLTDKPGPGTLQIDAITLDEHARKNALERLDMIKIDIEGAEVAALRGAGETIRRFMPAIAVEYNVEAAHRAGVSVEELDGLLDSYGYERFLFSGRLRRFDLKEWQKQQPREECFNVYALPRKKVSG